MSENTEIVSGNAQGDGDQPNANAEANKKNVDVTAADLPLHCPMPGKHLWDSHPRVFLPIADSGEETCPYCGTVYRLIGPVGSGH